MKSRFCDGQWGWIRLNGEAMRLLEESGLVHISAHWVNEMSWTVIGIKPDSQAP